MVALKAINFKLEVVFLRILWVLWTFLHVPAHVITVGDFQSDLHKCNLIKKLKGQRGS